MRKKHDTGSIHSEEKVQFPLVDSSYDNKEILNCISVLLGGQLTTKDIRERSLHCGEYTVQHHSLNMFSKAIKDALIEAIGLKWKS